MVIDVFPFFNEYELLETRVEMLKDVVDLHIAVTGTHTYQGEEIDWCAEDWMMFEHLGVQPWSVDTDGNFSTAWEREKYQRRQIREAVARFADHGDVVVYTDADELWRPRILDLPWGRLDAAALEMRVLYYGLQWEDPKPVDRGKIFRWEVAKDLDWNELRWQSPYWGTSDWPVLQDAGWHISYYGGPQRIETKLKSFSHVEYSTDEHIRRIQDGSRTGRGPNGERLVRVVESTLPTGLGALL